MKKKLPKLLVLIVCVFLGVWLVTINSLETNNKKEALTFSTVNKAIAKFENKSEVVSKRTETSRTYKLSDDSYRSLIYTAPIHYLENGLWKQIDVRLKKATEKKFYYSNTTNTVQSFFPKSLSDENRIKVQSNNNSYHLGNSFLFSLEDDPTKENKQADYSVNLNASKVELTSTNSVKYDNGNSLGYISYNIDNNSFKQNFILKKLPKEVYESSDKYFSMTETIELPEGWQIVADGKIVVNSLSTKSQLVIKNAKEELAFIIPLPEIYEEKKPSNILSPTGEMEHSFTVTKKGNSYQIKVAIPRTWLVDENRNFPVVIDPTANFVGGWGGWHNENGGSIVEGNPSDYVFTGKYETNLDFRSWSQFDVSAINDGSTVNSILLEMGMNLTDNEGVTETILVNNITGDLGPYGVYNASAFTDFGDGNYTSFAAAAAGTYSNLNIGATANDDLESSLSGDIFQIGWSIVNATSWKRFSSNRNNITVDWSPGTTISSTITNPTNVSSWPMTVAFGEAMNGFVEGDMVISNGTVSDFTTSDNTTFTFNLTPTAEGLVTVDVPAAVATGNVTTDPNKAAQYTATYDSVAPDAPAAPDMLAASDTGSLDTDNVTMTTTPSLQGTGAEANSKVKITSSIDGSLGMTTADGAGNWTFVPGALTEGSHNITVTSTDLVGNESVASPALTVVIDATANTPNTTDLADSSDSAGVSNTDNITNDTTPTLQGTGAEANATVTIISSVDGSLGTAIANGTGDWTFTPSTALTSNTPHDITVTYTDIAGNTSSASAALTITLDSVTPTGYSVIIDQDPINTGNLTSISFTFAGAEVGTTYNYTFSSASGTPVTGSGTIVSATDQITAIDLSPVGDGTVTLSVTLTDTAGNIGSLTTDTATKDTIARITVNNPSIAEGDSGATILQYTVSLSSPKTSVVTLDIATSDRTATSGSDYTALGTTTLTFNAGDVTKTVDITLSGDTALETNETLNLNLTNATGPSIISDATGVGTITNDDSAAVTIADISGNENDGAITITATLDNAVQGGFTVDVNTADVTATIANSDYTAITNRTLIFTGTAGETQTFTFSPTTDLKVEANETVAISQGNLSATTLGVVITDGATVTIDNDDTAFISIEDVSGNENDGNITLTATLDNPVDGGFMVNINFTDNTATTADSDYTVKNPLVLTFAGTTGETQTFTITPIADSKLEDDERLFIGLSNLIATTVDGSNVSTSDGAEVTILNDDTASVTIADVSGNEDDGTITLTATLDNAVDGGFTVDVSSTDGTATTGDSDYTAVTSETLTFTGTAGEIQTFTITPTTDTKLEANETLTISQSNLSATTLGVVITDTSTVTIDNDDSAAVTIADISGNEDNGTMTLTATLDNPVQGGFTVDVSTVDGTAITADSDYTAISSQTLTFTGTVGEMQTFTVIPTTDSKVEENETLSINQGNLSATTLGVVITDTATVTIDNDDTAAITLTNASANEADGTVSIVATLDNAVQGGFILNASTVDGTALATSDFTALTNQPAATFTGAAGETQNIVLTLTDDSTGEETETLSVTQSSISGTTVGASITITDTATVTIIDDDAPVVTMVSVPTDGNYGIGDNLDFTVTFTNPANTTGSPSIPITIGTATVQAVLNGTFTNSLTADFRYTIVESDLDTDGIGVGTTIDLNGGTILGNTNIPAILTLNNVGSTTNINVDGIKPTVILTTDAANPTNSTFTTTFTFSEAVTGFEVSDITLGNGAASNFTTTSSTVYTALITPTTDGIVTVNIAADVANDAVTNGNIPATEYSVLYDITAPTVDITSPVANPTNSTFTTTFTFSEAVTDFVIGDVTLGNATASNFTATSTTVYTALITPTTDGTVTVDIAADVAIDAATNGNTIATQFSRLYDVTPPVAPVVISVTDYTCAGNTNFTGDKTLLISGTAEPNSTVTVFGNLVFFGSTTTDTAGNWVLDNTSEELPDAVYILTALASDSANNISNRSSQFYITVSTIDTDSDGEPDFCDADDDNDGILDADDNSYLPNPDQADSNNNGIGDVQEDCDNDGILNYFDEDVASCQESIVVKNKYGFSPNGDGINDTWVIENIALYPNNLVSVYNRSGKVVYQIKGYNNTFDGVSNKVNSTKKLPVGAYYFTIEFNTPGAKPATGWIYINY